VTVHFRIIGNWVKRILLEAKEKKKLKMSLSKKRRIGFHDFRTLDRRGTEVEIVEPHLLVGKKVFNEASKMGEEGLRLEKIGG